MRRLFASILMLACAPALSGCAAAALPVATSLLMGKSAFKGDGSARNAEAAAQPRVASPAPIPTPTAPSTPIPVGTNEIATITSMTALPAPGASISAPGARSTSGEFEGLFAAATAVAQRDPFSETKRSSALLAAPGELSPERAECGFAQTAVLIDLDPGEDAAPLGEDAVAPQDLVRVLATLRAQEVAVLWLSRHTADRAGAVRRALRRTGLDPRGQDEIYLVRYENESKATRRANAGGDYCIVAILGDEKRDFDELFAYLKDEEAAFALNRLIGEAWFLAPPPLTSPSTPEES
tara:strand:- start:139 stop:1023 length:885 start_codon:yes stop_codon:yes gene_type:complete